MIAFSVLIPVYIKENPAFLRLALKSVLDDQTLKPNEMVIVEDGPLTEELTAVLDDFSARYPIIKRYKLPENRGMGAAMNFGLQKATCEWIARMDSDDIATPDRFAKQVAVLTKNPDIDVLGSAIEEFDKTMGDLGRYRVLAKTHEDLVKLMKFRSPINHMTVFYRRELALRAGGYWSNRHLEDYNLWYEMMKAGGKFYNIQESLVLVRVGNNMIGRRIGTEYFGYEKVLLKKFLHDKFITYYEYLVLTTGKFMLRLLPPQILGTFYSVFLRRSVLHPAEEPGA